MTNNKKTKTTDAEGTLSPVREAIAKAIDLIVTKFGKGAIMALGGEPGELPTFEAIPTGSLHLDRALGIGGLPKGRIVELSGP